MRSFRRYRSHSILSLTGLTVGMTVFLLIVLWVNFQWSFDKFHANGDRIYRVILGYQEGVGVDEAVAPMPLGQALVEEYTEFEASTIFIRPAIAFRRGDAVYNERPALVSDDFLTMFSFQLLSGEASEVLRQPNSIVLSEDFAHRVFGDEDPVGQYLEHDDTTVLKVTGVIADAPGNSHLQYECLMPISFFGRFDRGFDDWGDISFKMYVMLAPGVSEDVANQRITECLARHNPDSEDRYYLQPLHEIQLYSDFKFDYAGLGNINHVRMLSGVAVIVLLLACFNYIGLSAVMFTRRASEVGIRQVAGAGRRQLASQFLVETMMTATVAILLGMAMVEATLPWMNGMAGTKIEFAPLHQPWLLATLVCLLVVTGVLTGLYPALHFSRFKPVSILGARYSGGPRGTSLRRLLVGIQFVMAIVLIAATLVVYRQLIYISSKDLGYDRADILSLRLNGDQSDHLDVLRQRLARIPGVENGTGVTSLLTRVGGGTSGADWEGRPDDVRVQMQFIGTDYDFADAFGIEIVAGRFLSRDHASDAINGFVVNEAAVRAMGMDSAVGKRFSVLGVEGTIIGVMRDFHYASLHSPIEPIFVAWTPDWYGYRYLCLRLSETDMSRTVEAVESAWNEVFPETACQFSFLDEQIDGLYRSEQLVGKLLTVFTGLALLVASLGLFSLVALAVERRTKEIGVRKVLGASIPGVIYTLAREYTVLVIAANALAWPIAYLAMDRWLESFVYRVELNAGTFLLAGVLALVTAGCTVGWQAFRAARANPVEALRYE